MQWLDPVPQCIGSDGVLDLETQSGDFLDGCLFADCTLELCYMCSAILSLIMIAADNIAMRPLFRARLL